MLGEKIAQLRKEKKVSQEELADALFTSRQAVSKWERGESDPDIDRLKDLAIFFGVSIDYLLGYDIESDSVNSFIKKLKVCLEDATIDISIDEIKTVVSKNTNNLTLLGAVIEYLFAYYSSKRDTSVADLIIEYGKRAIHIYQPEEAKKIDINNIHQAIALAYSMKKQYDLEKAYIEENNVQHMKHDLANCEFELGNNDKAIDLASDLFIDAVSDLVNANMLQSRILLKTNRIEEAYSLTDWSISFIKSLEKKEGLLIEIIAAHSFIKAICEKHLGLDYSKTIKTIRSNIKQINNAVNNSESLKYYYKPKINFIILNDDLKKSIEKELESLKESEIYETAKETYKELFGGEESCLKN